MFDLKVLNGEIADKWNAYWKEHGLMLFDEKDSEKPLFSIDTPPPFVTGELHMGQAFWVCYIDTIARYKKLAGHNILYPQGWDSQGFPIEIKVEEKYGRDMGRKEFYNKCKEVALNNITNMRKTMRKLGASFDERYEYRTLDDDYRAKVQRSLIEMHEKGYVYRAVHPVEWCPHCDTAIAREETVEVEGKDPFNYIAFDVKGSKKKLIIATTRPEMLHACVAVAVNPDDDRYKSLIGKEAAVPLFGRHVKIIGDEVIDKELGTGAEMICTFGDKNDVVLYYKHKLEMIDAIDSKGRLKNADDFSGLGTKEAREKILEALKNEGRLEKQETITHTYKVHDRCKSRIELRSVMQWFLKTKEYSDSIRERGHDIKWYPEAPRQKLDDWIDYIEWDWNFSRNRVFGTPIPFWYCKDCGEIVAPKAEDLPVNPALEKSRVQKCPKCGGELAGENDTCDVWIDSSITPLVVSGWPEKGYDQRFPPSVRIQGSDIIRTWLFYTTYRVWALTGNKPFENLILHGMILGTDGKEMHKSEGNGIGVDELTEKYPIDAVRLWVALGGGIGKDRQFSYKDLDYARGFLNKLYNTAMFTKGAIDRADVPEEEPKKHMGLFDVWILHRLNQTIKDVRAAYDSFNLNEAANKMLNFYWHEFADYYIEDVKYRIYSEDKKMAGSRKAAAYTLRKVVVESLGLFAPIIPYVSEEINSWFSKSSIFEGSAPQYVEEIETSDYVINGLLFEEGFVKIDYEDIGAFVNNVIGEVRKRKSEAHMALNAEISTININVPEAYYKVSLLSKGEIEGICKAKNVEVKKGESFSVSISM